MSILTILSLKELYMNNKIKKNITCFSSHEKFNVNCNKKSCRYYLEYPDHQNCVINMSKDKKYTMQKIGEIFNCEDYDLFLFPDS